MSPRPQDVSGRRVLGWSVLVLVAFTLALWFAYPAGASTVSTSTEDGCGWSVAVSWDSPTVTEVRAVRTDPDVPLALMVLLLDEVGTTLHASEPSMRESVTWTPPRVSTAQVAVVPLAATDGCQVVVPRPTPEPPAYAPPAVVPGDHRTTAPAPAEPQDAPTRLLATR